MRPAETDRSESCALLACAQAGDERAFRQLGAAVSPGARSL